MENQKQTPKTKYSKYETWRSAFLAGVCIGIAGFGFLVEKNIIGEVLFCFGLLTVVHYGLKLYTGTAGFIHRNEFGHLFRVLAGNWLGCLFVALMLRFSPMPLQETAQGILAGRLAVGPLGGAILAVGCGFIMTTSVNFSRQGKNLPLFFGVPLFIVCGFPHCVADAFYYMCVPVDFLWANALDILIFYVSIVFGNFVGCNLYRLVMEKMDFKFASKPVETANNHYRPNRYNQNRRRPRHRSEGSKHNANDDAAASASN